MPPSRPDQMLNPLPYLLRRKTKSTLTPFPASGPKPASTKSSKLIRKTNKTVLSSRKSVVLDSCR